MKGNQLRVILTGASMGIGAAAARAFAADGARLLLVARSQTLLEEVAADVKARGGEAVYLPVDLTKSTEVARIVPAAVEALGGVDVLVNNAGVGIGATVAGMRMEDFRHLMELNLFCAVMLIQSVVPHMRAQGGGVIVNVSSMISKFSFPTAGGYCASKSALNAISDAARIELAPYKIRVATVCPGIVKTDWSKHLLGSERKPMGPKPWTAEAVAQVIVAAAKDPPRERVLGWQNKVLVGLARLAPGLLAWGMGRAYARRSRIACEDAMGGGR